MTPPLDQYITPYRKLSEASGARSISEAKGVFLVGALESYRDLKTIPASDLKASGRWMAKRLCRAGLLTWNVKEQAWLTVT